MGGIVARALVASPPSSGPHTWATSDIMALITMSTPHSLAPVRFSQAIEAIYTNISRCENSSESTSNRVPTLAICGGSADALIPSETCHLPPLESSPPTLWYRKTVHTTSLPGVWTGVGHREMVWCHQVRWRVARAALALGEAAAHEAGGTLARWFPSPDDPVIPIQARTHELNLETTPHTIVMPSTALRLPNPGHTKHAHLIPIPTDPASRNLTLMLARGVLLHPPSSVTDTVHHPSTLCVRLYHCPPDGSDSPATTCSPLPLDPSSETRLIPLPLAGKEFPGTEGVDESEGVVFWRGKVSSPLEGWIAVHVELETVGDNEGWVVAGFDGEEPLFTPRTTRFGTLPEPRWDSTAECY